MEHLSAVLTIQLTDMFQSLFVDSCAGVRFKIELIAIIVSGNVKNLESLVDDILINRYIGMPINIVEYI